jgi:hypothetical protein
MYDRSSGRTLLSIVRMYDGGPPDACSANSTPDVCYFLYTLWVIPGRTRYPLNQHAKTTRRTLGLLNIRCSVRELVADFLYK